MKTPSSTATCYRPGQKAALLARSILALVVSGPVVLAAPAARGPAKEFPMKIRMDVDGREVVATLEDTAASRDFGASLPLSLTLTNYAQIERIADLPRKLSIEGAPAGVTPRTGDITYYAPWGNLAIFVEGGSYSRGLVRLGKVDTGLPALRRPGPLQVRIERIPD